MFQVEDEWHQVLLVESHPLSPSISDFLVRIVNACGRLERKEVIPLVSREIAVAEVGLGMEVGVKDDMTDVKRLEVDAVGKEVKQEADWNRDRLVQELVV